MDAPDEDLQERAKNHVRVHCKPKKPRFRVAGHQNKYNHLKAKMKRIVVPEKVPNSRVKYLNFDNAIAPFLNKPNIRYPSSSTDNRRLVGMHEKLRNYSSSNRHCLDMEEIRSVKSLRDQIIEQKGDPKAQLDMRVYKMQKNHEATDVNKIVKKPMHTNRFYPMYMATNHVEHYYDSEKDFNIDAILTLYTRIGNRIEEQANLVMINALKKRPNELDHFVNWRTDTETNFDLRNDYVVHKNDFTNVGREVAGINSSKSNVDYLEKIRVFNWLFNPYTCNGIRPTYDPVVHAKLWLYDDYMLGGRKTEMIHEAYIKWLMMNAQFFWYMTLFGLICEDMIVIDTGDILHSVLSSMTRVESDITKAKVILVEYIDKVNSTIASIKSMGVSYWLPILSHAFMCNGRVNVLAYIEHLLEVFQDNKDEVNEVLKNLDWFDDDKNDVYERLFAMDFWLPNNRIDPNAKRPYEYHMLQGYELHKEIEMYPPSQPAQGVSKNDEKFCILSTTRIYCHRLYIRAGERWLVYNSHEPNPVLCVEHLLHQLYEGDNVKAFRAAILDNAVYLHMSDKSYTISCGSRDQIPFSGIMYAMVTLNKPHKPVSITDRMKGKGMVVGPNLDCINMMNENKARIISFEWLFGKLATSCIQKEDNSIGYYHAKVSILLMACRYQNFSMIQAGEMMKHNLFAQTVFEVFATKFDVALTKHMYPKKTDTIKRVKPNLVSIGTQTD